jgi:hypothetical protein
MASIAALVYGLDMPVAGRFCSLDFECLYSLSEIPEVPRRTHRPDDAVSADPSTGYASSVVIPQ